jgi:ribonuclease inhibitor
MKMTVVLDGKAMVDRASAHSYLAQQLELPTWYGRNLDALYDVLTQIGEETKIILTDPAAAVEQMGKYGEALLSTMQEAAEENPKLIVTLQ